jgi:hypothetical protein
VVLVRFDHIFFRKNCWWVILEWFLVHLYWNLFTSLVSKIKPRLCCEGLLLWYSQLGKYFLPQNIAIFTYRNIRNCIVVSRLFSQKTGFSLIRITYEWFVRREWSFVSMVNQKWSDSYETYLDIDIDEKKYLFAL